MEESRGGVTYTTEVEESAARWWSAALVGGVAVLSVALVVGMLIVALRVTEWSESLMLGLSNVWGDVRGDGVLAWRVLIWLCVAGLAAGPAAGWLLVMRLAARVVLDISLHPAAPGWRRVSESTRLLSMPSYPQIKAETGSEAADFAPGPGPTSRRNQSANTTQRDHISTEVQER